MSGSHCLKKCQTCRKLYHFYITCWQCPPQMSRNCEDASKTSEQFESRVHWTCSWRHGTSVYVLAFVLETNISSIRCKNDVTYYTFDDFRDNNYQWFCSYSMKVLRWQLNLSLQISQGSASTHYRWSGHFLHSFVSCVIQDMPTKFCRNRFIFDPHRAKDKLAQFFYTRCMWFLCFSTTLA